MVERITNTYMTNISNTCGTVEYANNAELHPESYANHAELHIESCLFVFCQPYIVRQYVACRHVEETETRFAMTISFDPFLVSSAHDATVVVWIEYWSKRLCSETNFSKNTGINTKSPDTERLPSNATVVEEESDSTTKKPTDRPADEPTSRPMDKQTAKSMDWPKDKPTDKPTSHPRDKPTDKPTNWLVDKPNDKPTSPYDGKTNG